MRSNSLSNVKKTYLLSALGIVLAALLYITLGHDSRGEMPESPPPDADRIIDVEERDPAPNAAPEPPPAIAPGSESPGPPPSKQTPTLSPKTAAIASECSRDEECRGPRHADCIGITCRQGKCNYDKSNCECRTAADCEDNDPCTRNHCFSSTMRCIFIPKDDCERTL